ncbi:hypothetical protein LRD18_10155 [Halorhodospira halochloris]|nr:hypothetical protein [Halorhodospira halochloris]MCG5531223.1 hypothetical protein [Halorhodospira halochloris]
MPRAVAHFHAAGLDPIPAPTRQKTGLDPRDELDFWVPSAKALRMTERALYEYMGLVAARLGQ